ncbi:hypothetical protein CPB83DRAFT_855550 [Crepidotus variabilis]|uniref:Membrane-associated proteins in eicosanoid and glutathione metabolism n=1 Tax=Crepidotus variabilis TaxID=179855 RepID=A0A9P6EF29_9AGAR|nr:hypothetical protein CPB83DRAFT_855550 [Crepidotus variabilis]
MPITYTVPDGLPWVGGALVSSAWLLLFQSLVVSKHRGRAGIKYPQAYADKEEQEKSPAALKFNCAQRAHMNTLEIIPSVWATTLITATKYPHVAASVLGFWVVGRIFYTRGYVTGDPKKRVSIIYRLSSLGILGLLLSSTFVTGQAIYHSLYL